MRVVARMVWANFLRSMESNRCSDIIMATAMPPATTPRTASTETPIAWEKVTSLIREGGGNGAGGVTTSSSAKRPKSTPAVERLADTSPPMASRKLARNSSTEAQRAAGPRNR